MTSAGTSLPQGHQFQLDLDTAQRIKDAVVSLDGVAELSAGSFGEVSLLFAGARVGGIRKPSPAKTQLLKFTSSLMSPQKRYCRNLEQRSGKRLWLLARS